MKCLGKFRSKKLDVLHAYGNYLLRTKRHRRLSRILAQEIARDPTCAALWSLALSLQGKVTFEAQHIRQTIQRALRFAPECQELYMRLIQLEVNELGKLLQAAKEMEDALDQEKSLETCAPLESLPYHIMLSYLKAIKIDALSDTKRKSLVCVLRKEIASLCSVEYGRQMLCDTLALLSAVESDASALLREESADTSLACNLNNIGRLSENEVDTLAEGL